MTAAYEDATLDSILALQVTVAWAGEGRCTPRRLGWWDTDLIDVDGGGDFLKRLLPGTHAWAALEAPREAARRIDAKARAQLASADEARTIFFLGFELDEVLDDRLHALKRSGLPPSEVLPLAVSLSAGFDKEQVARTLGGGDASFTIVPGGRHLDGVMPAEPNKTVTRLAAALVPFTDRYPLPFYAIRG